MKGGSPKDPAYIDAGTNQALSRQDVKTGALKLAWGLQNRVSLGSGGPLKRGDTIMLMSPNSLSWPLTLFGSVAAGLRISFASCSATPRELVHQYLDSKPRIILVASHLVPIVREMFNLVGGPSAQDVEERIWVMDGLADYAISAKAAVRKDGAQDCVNLMKGEALKSAERFDGDAAEETVYICYSSGTTGKPKGVETSHKNISSVLSMTQALWKGCETPKDVYLAVLPVYHMFGLAIQLHYPFRRAKPVVMVNTGFSVPSFCRAVERYKVTSVLVVPPIILDLSESKELDKYNLSSITNISSGAAPLSIALAAKFLDRLKARGANPVLLQGCGSTETTCPCQIVRPEESVKKFGSVGALLPNIEARLVVEAPGDSGGFRDAEEGEEGEMWLKGPTITKGYLNNPQANASTFTKDGWFRTGDVLRRDEDGYYYIMDRKKEMLKYKHELESLLMENPEVGDAGVIGIMDVYSGNELPRAYVRPANPNILSNPAEKQAYERRIAKWVEGQVSSYKYLRGGVIAIPEVPKSGTGKILRNELREWAKAEVAEREKRRAVGARL
ncbi:AMP binding protein [Coprinopsis sp. MPI-PUGE-AT-0042]|nr:AMP binding protein [Coprinopsis sp. MPI-PUGE-AT-0042]